LKIKLNDIKKDNKIINVFVESTYPDVYKVLVDDTEISKKSYNSNEAITYTMNN
jgi:hypothetical protein